MPFIELPVAKEFLNIQDSVTDAALAATIEAIVPIVEREVGPVVERSETSIVDSNGVAALPLSNVQDVTAIMQGSTALDVTEVEVVGSVLQRIDRTPLPAGRLVVTYTVGLDPVPGNITNGALEVLKLAWAARLKGELPAFLLSYRASAWFAPDQKLLGFA